MPAPYPVVLVHGYSDVGESFGPWKEALEARGFDVSTIHVCSYQSLTNEVTIKDIAEGFDRALRIEAGLKEDAPFSAIVHSTGMLVVRSWLTTYAKRANPLNRVDRLKHLIGLAPATFGSPLAHKGRSWMGSVFKGNKTPGPDFMEAGDEILDGLELASRFTWDLAHEDLVGKTRYYGVGDDTPYPFILCGNEDYGGLRGLVNAPGTDGTVRMAGTAMNCRKVLLDLTHEPMKEKDRTTIEPPPGVDAPVYLIDGLNHATIMSEPPEELVGLVADALRVEDAADYKAWQAAAAKVSARAAEEVDEYQQFIVRALDERGDPITDYHLQVSTRDTKGFFRGVREFDADVHVYDRDKSLRSFHVNLTKLNKLELDTLKLRIIASSGSRLVAYHGINSEVIDKDGSVINEDGQWDAQIDLSRYLATRTFKLFFPFTTTLIELRLNREPMPLDHTGENDVCWFLPRKRAL
jgi:hypothetical protein